MTLMDLYRVLDSDTTVFLLNALHEDDEQQVALWLGKPDDIPFIYIEDYVYKVKGQKIYIEHQEG